MALKHFEYPDMYALAFYREGRKLAYDRLVFNDFDPDEAIREIVASAGNYESFRFYELLANNKVPVASLRDIDAAPFTYWSSSTYHIVKPHYVFEEIERAKKILKPKESKVKKPETKKFRVRLRNFRIIPVSIGDFLVNSDTKNVFAQVMPNRLHVFENGSKPKRPEMIGRHGNVVLITTLKPEDRA